MWSRFCGRFEKKCELRWPKMSKRCQKGAQKAHFLEPKASFLGAKFARVALCESIIIYCVLLTLSHQKSMRERTKNRCGNAMCARDAFFPLLYALYALKCCPRSHQGHPKGPKGSPKASPGTPQNHEKIDLGAWEAPGVPSGRKMTQKSMKKRLILMYYIIYYILYTIY